MAGRVHRQALTPQPPSPAASRGRGGLGGASPSGSPLFRGVPRERGAGGVRVRAACTKLAAMRRRIWCETVPAETLGAPATVALLRRYAVLPIVAVWPGSVGAARAALARFEDAGLPAAAWPMLPDDAGRWLSAANAAPFAAF